MTKSPSRAPGYAAALHDATARHGLICFLCGQVHSRSDTLQPDYIKPLDAGGKADSVNTVPVCKTCAKRRNRRPLGVYFRQRLIEAQRELDYLNRLGENRELFAAMAATISVVPHAVDGTGQTDSPATNPLEGIVPTLFLEELMVDAEDYDREVHIGRPKGGKHGDVYQCADYHTGELEEFVFDGEKNRWRDLGRLKKEGKFPEEWPPANAVVWRA